MTTAESSLQTLKEGNRRYVAGRPQHPHQDAARRKETLSHQRPFAVILGCADSRVPPEILFDQGVGDLFVVRTAGHVVDRAVLGSIEYAVEHLNVSLVVVLGHTRCGAVTAAVQSASARCASHPGSIGHLVEAILPAVQQAAGLAGDPVAHAIDAHIRHTVETLAAVPALAERIRSGALRIVGARYDLETGKVAWLDS
ncbi:MAG: carbonic anhydrase [Anaerolineae bacterium]|nr:carbonic anhydrase [Anaerolineae bacterium]MDW8067619.1 carbonic anhydrase [Anaerolineae bacterium]